MRIERRVEPVQRRAIGADDLVVVAEIEKNMRMIEGRIGADAHELLRADLDHRDASIVVEVRNDMVGHYLHLGWQSSRTQATRRSGIETQRTILAGTGDS